MPKSVREYQQMCRTVDVALLGIEARGRHYALHFERGFLIAVSTPSIIARATTSRCDPPPARL